MSNEDKKKHRIKLEYSKEIEIALDDLQVFTECYKALLKYHREKGTQPTPLTMMDTQDKLNQAILAIIEGLLEQSGYNTRVI